MSLKKAFLIIFIITAFLLSFDAIFALGCVPYGSEIFWDNECTISGGTWYSFYYDEFGGGSYACAIHPQYQDGYTISYYWTRMEIPPWPFYCHADDYTTHWKYMEIDSWPTGASEGDICAVNQITIFGCKSRVFNGKWDPDDWGCVQCFGNKQETIHKCTDGRSESATYECESACGAHPACDELSAERWCVGNVAWERDCSTCNTLPVENCEDMGPDYYCSSGYCIPRSRRGGGGGCLPWECVYLPFGVFTREQLFSITVIAVVGIIVIIFGVLKFFAKKK